MFFYYTSFAENSPESLLVEAIAGVAIASVFLASAVGVFRAYRAGTQRERKDTTDSNASLFVQAQLHAPLLVEDHRCSVCARVRAPADDTLRSATAGISARTASAPGASQLWTMVQRTAGASAMRRARQTGARCSCHGCRTAAMTRTETEMRT